MAVQNIRQRVAYGLTDPLLNVFPLPIVSKRSPTPNDHAQIGQTWINTATNQVYTLSSVVANVANWAVSAVGGGGLTQANADVGFAVTIADAMNFLGGLNINTSGAANTITINLNPSVSVTGSLTAGTTVTAGTSISATAGNITAVIGNVVAGADVIATTGLQVLAFGDGVLQSNALGDISSTMGGNGQVLISGGPAPIWNTITPGANIAIVNGPGSITISAATGALDLNYTGVAASPYVVLGTDDYIGVNTTVIPITIELPNAPGVGRAFVIKDSFGNAGTNNITVTTVGGAVLIDGFVAQVMVSPFGSLQVIFNGTFYELY